MSARARPTARMRRADQLTITADRLRLKRGLPSCSKRGVRFDLI